MLHNETWLSAPNVCITMGSAQMGRASVMWSLAWVIASLWLINAVASDLRFWNSKLETLWCVIDDCICNFCSNLAAKFVFGFGSTLFHPQLQYCRLKIYPNYSELQVEMMNVQSLKSADTGQWEDSEHGRFKNSALRLFFNINWTLFPCASNA